jgi:antitoxin ParD1/3/4
LKCAKYSYILFMRISEVSMASTSVTLGPHWDEFIALMLKEGRYGSTSELIRASLRLMEEQEGQRARLRVALMEGKQSGDAGPLDMDAIKREARSRSGASDA